MQLTIKNRLRSLAVLPVLFLSVFLLSLNHYEASKLVESQLKDTKEQLLSVKKQELQNYIDIALSSVAQYSQDAASKQQGLARLKQLAYGEGGYFFGYDSKGVRHLLGNSEAGIGKSFWDLQDKKSQYIVRDLVKTSKQKNGGFYVYYFPRLGETMPMPKLSYVRYIPAWDMAIGAGFYIDDIDAYINKLRQDAQQASSSTFIKTLLISLLVITIAVTITIFISRVILVRLDSLSHSLVDLTKGEGDLTKRVATTGNDEITTLAKGFNSFAEHIHQLVKQVRKQTHTASGSTTKMETETTHALTQLKQSQSNGQKVSKLVNEFVASAKAVASNANVTATSANEAKSHCDHVDLSIKQTVDVITGLESELGTSAQQIANLQQDVIEISDVLAVINSIADQTNLLALNAAIEAARAGEQGRGFAVVAEEVRELAKRTQGSTEEINQTIARLQQSASLAVTTMGASSEKSIKASQVASQSQSALVNMLEALKIINDNSDLIANETDEQVALGDQVQQQVNQMVITLQNAVSQSELNQTTTQSLSDQMHNLTELMERFKT